jgi:hyperosmotically inducible protein
MLRKSPKVSRILAALFLVVMATSVSAQTPAQREALSQTRLEKEVRHVLVTLPFYSVFDNLAYKVDGDRVTLLGQVVSPSLKSGAEKSVKSIEGVAAVDNKIEVLPLSTGDDRIRRAQFRAIYSGPGMQKYAIQAVPPLHIIVKGGHVTLVGVVASQADKTIALTRAKSVPGVFSVNHELRVEK